MTPDTILHLDPALILADDNARYGLKETAIEHLAKDIIMSGGVHTPVEVEELPTVTDDGHVYRLTYGYYRHAAVTWLNQSYVPGMLLPAVVRPPADAAVRLQRQLSENVARENLSPMDMAVAIDKLIAAGVAKADIRAVFARPTGKKSLALRPASNAWVNMVHSLLKLPKPIRERIHDGRIGLGGAYQLTRVSPERREALVARIEAARIEDMEAEEREEAKYLATTRTPEVKVTSTAAPAEKAPAKAPAPAKAKPAPKPKTKAPPKAIGAAEVKQAAKAEGAAKAGPQLTAAEMRKALAEMIVPTYPTVTKIIQALQACFAGGPTPQATLRELAVLVNEPKRPKAVQS